MNTSDLPPFQKHSDTSLAAAEEIDIVSGYLRKLVWNYLLTVGRTGATDDEMQVALDMNPSTQRPRRVELVEAGLVFDSFFRRKTRTGRSAVVWLALTDETKDLSLQSL